MRRLVIVADTYFPMKDGVLTYLRSIIPLLRRDYRITLVAPRLRKEEGKTLGVRTVLLRPLPLELASYRVAVPSLGLARAIRQADLVLVNDLAPLGAAAVRLAHAMGKPLFLFCHHDEGEMLHHAFKLGEKPLLPAGRLSNLVDRIVARHYRYADVVFVATHKFYEKLRRLRVPEEKIVFTPFAVDWKRFSPSTSSREAVRRKHGIPREAKVVLYLGRMSHEKNVETLIRSIPRVQSALEDAWFLFVGGGPRLREYLRLARSLGIDGRAVFPGEVEWEEVPGYLSAADVFVHPSLHESQSFTVMEAMAASLPVVVPREPSSEYSYLEEGVNCVFLRDAKSHEELAGLIISLLRNPWLRAELGRNAREKMKSYSWREHVEKLARCFEQVETKNPGGIKRKLVTNRYTAAGIFALFIYALAKGLEHL